MQTVPIGTGRSVDTVQAMRIDIGQEGGAKRECKKKEQSVNLHKRHGGEKGRKRENSKECMVPVVPPV